MRGEKGPDFGGASMQGWRPCAKGRALSTTAPPRRLIPVWHTKHGHDLRGSWANDMKLTSDLLLY